MDAGLQKLSHADDCHGLSPFLLVLVICSGGSGVEPGVVRAGTATQPTHRVVGKNRCILAAALCHLELRFRAQLPITRAMEVGTDVTSEPLAKLAADIKAEAWDLALAVVDEGLRDDTIPTLARLGRVGQLGDMPTFIAELADQLLRPKPDRLRRGSPLAALVRDHAREREALGFAPRDIVTEFLLLRRVLWRLVLERSGTLDAQDVLVLEERLHDMIDSLVAECVVAYFDRATSELAHQARHDALTNLLNHAAFTRELELELERAKRYASSVTLLFFDFDDFKEINDTHGHQAGDHALAGVAEILRGELRRSDVAGRMGGDEFAAFLVESHPETGKSFLARLESRISELVASGELTVPIAISAGIARSPEDGQDADGLFAVADSRLYEAKRSKAA
jgi:diguanylate cyclase (GGDEF)-like protein